MGHLQHFLVLQLVQSSAWLRRGERKDVNGKLSKSIE